MKKEIFVSFYDSGYEWSICFGNRIYTRQKYKDHYYLRLVKMDVIFEWMEIYSWCISPDKLLETIHELYPQYSKLIWCEDGYIQIYNIKKGGKRK